MDLKNSFPSKPAKLVRLIYLKKIQLINTNDSSGCIEYPLFARNAARKQPMENGNRLVLRSF